MSVVLTHHLTCEAAENSSFNPAIVLGACLIRAHVAAAGGFAVAFPEAQVAPAHAVGRLASPVLGKTLRLFGDAAVLERIVAGLADVSRHLLLLRIEPVPSPAGFETYRRVRNAVRTEATVARELRRAERRAAARGEDIPATERGERRQSLSGSRLPYVPMASLSTRERFTIRIDRSASATELAGRFDSYGFGLDGATVPVI
jgi:CRISPR-associated endoribonuclease Cas6/Csy4 subtype I-F